MNVTIKAAWMGIAGTVVLSIITIVGPLYLNRLQEKPSEGLFSVNLSFIKSVEINPVIRDQIKFYPCVLKISHIDGPAVEGLTVIIDSENPIDTLIKLQDEEHADILLSSDRKHLQIDISTLRKGSVVQYNFSSIGQASLRNRVIVKSGKPIKKTD